MTQDQSSSVETGPGPDPTKIISTNKVPENTETFGSRIAGWPSQNGVPIPLWDETGTTPPTEDQLIYVDLSGSEKSNEAYEFKKRGGAADTLIIFQGAKYYITASGLSPSGEKKVDVTHTGLNNDVTVYYTSDGILKTSTLKRGGSGTLTVNSLVPYIEVKIKKKGEYSLKNDNFSLGLSPNKLEFEVENISFGGSVSINYFDGEKEQTRPLGSFEKVNIVVEQTTTVAPVSRNFDFGGLFETAVHGRFHRHSMRFRKEAPNSEDGSLAHVGSSRSAVMQRVADPITGELKFFIDMLGHRFTKQHDVGGHDLNIMKNILDFVFKDSDHQLVGNEDGFGTFENHEGKKYHIARALDRRSGRERQHFLEDSSFMDDL